MGSSNGDIIEVLDSLPAMHIVAAAGALAAGLCMRACEHRTGNDAPPANVGEIRQTVPMPQQETTGDLVKALLQRLDVK